MARFERLCDLPGYRDRLVNGDRTFLDPLRQRLALDVLHDEEIDAVLLAHVIKGADVRMVELRNHLGFTLEARLAFGALGQVLREDLDGNRPVEPSVLGFVDLAHAPLADWGEDFVRAEARSGCEGHSYPYDLLRTLAAKEERINREGGFSLQNTSLSPGGEKD